MKGYPKIAGALAAGTVAVTSFLTGSASGADPVIVRVPACAFNGGTTTVPAGAPVVLRLGGYADGTEGLISVARKAQTTTLAITAQGAAATYDLSNAWSQPTQLDKGLWLIRQPDVAVASLAPGQTMTVSYDITFNHPVSVLFPPVGPTGDNGPVVVTEDGPYTCEITAV